MAHDNTEIEIKLAASPEIFSRIRKRLSREATPSGKTHHVDTYFTPSHRNFVSPQYPYEWLSIRRRGDDTLLCYKHWHPEGSERTTHCDELETVLKDPDQVERILKAVDFSELVTVDKTREAFRVGEDFEVAMDTVKELGHFVEIESLRSMGSVEETRERLKELARDLGLDPLRLERRGYPYQLMKKKGLVG